MKGPNRDHFFKLGILGICFVVGVALSYWSQSSKRHEVNDERPREEKIVRKKVLPPRAPAQTLAGTRPLTPYGDRPTSHPSRTTVALDFNAKVELELSRDFELSLEYRAAPLSRYRSSLGERMAMVNGFVIYKLAQELAQKEAAIAFEENSFPVVRDPNNGLVGLITGRVIVKLHDQDFDVESFTGGEKIYEADHLNVSYVKIPPLSNLEEIYLALKERPEVMRVDLEILQGGVVLK